MNTNNMESPNYLEEWSNHVNVPIQNLTISTNSEKGCCERVFSGNPIIRVKPCEFGAWEIREQDRPDYRDWMPYHIRFPGHEIRVYYVNVNSRSESHDNHVVLRASFVSEIDEFTRDGTPVTSVCVDDACDSSEDNLIDNALKSDSESDETI